jgi:hypothetical protein
MKTREREASRSPVFRVGEGKGLPCHLPGSKGVFRTREFLMMRIAEISVGAK